MITCVFLVILFATLLFGAHLGTRLTRTSARVDGWVAADERGAAVCDAAASAETACDWSGEL